ncbi:ulp1 protease family protein [Colletotrichum asianum]
MARLAAPTGHPLRPVQPTANYVNQISHLLSTFSTSAATLYFKLRDFENSVVRVLAHADPVAIRSALPYPCALRLVQLLPQDLFVIDKKSSPKLQKAAASWGIHPTVILFQIGYDYASHSNKFFAALVTLAGHPLDWNHCIRLLEARSSTRHTGASKSKKDLALARFKGISLNDVTSLLDDTQQDEPEVPRSAHGTIQESEQHISPASPFVSSSSSSPQAASHSLASESNLKLRTPTLDQTTFDKTIDAEHKPRRISQTAVTRDSGLFEANDGQSQPSSSLWYSPSLHRFSSGVTDDATTVDAEAFPEPEPHQISFSDTEDSTYTPFVATSISDPTTDIAVGPLTPSVAPATSGSTTDIEEVAPSPAESRRTSLHGDEESPLIPSETTPVKDRTPEIAVLPLAASIATPLSDPSTDVQVIASSPLPSDPVSSDESTILPLMMIPDPDPKRQRLDAIPPGEDAFKEMLQTKTWIKDDWVNAALARVTDLSSETYLVDSWVAKSVMRDDYKPFREIGRRLCQTRRVLMVINVDLEHWVLAIIHHDGPAANKVELLDSLPSKKNLAHAQTTVSGFIRHYLPETSARASRVTTRLCHRQDNNTDCGVFVFAFGMKVLVVVLGGVVSDWGIPLPSTHINPTENSQDQQDGESRVEDEDVHVDEYTRYERSMTTLRKQANKLAQQLEKDIQICDHYNEVMSPVLQVMSKLSVQASARAAVLQRQIDTARRLAAMRETNAARETREDAGAAVGDQTTIQSHLLRDRILGVAKAIRVIENELRRHDNIVTTTYEACSKRRALIKQ